MTNHMVIALVVAGAGLLSAQTPASAQGQTKPRSHVAANSDTLPGAEAVKAFVAARIKKNWMPPRTPWGDPDISGNFTTKDEYTTPFERPAEWAGRRMEDITPAEFAAAVARWQKESSDRLAPLRPINWFTTLEGRNNRPWFVIDPPDGKVPELTAEGKKRAIRGERVANSYTDRPLSERCIMYGGLRTPGPYGNSQQILQTPNYVLIRQEQIHEARIVSLDGRPQPSSKIRSYYGIPQGHWDGNTLVVVSTNFRDEMDFRGSPLGNARIIERFTRTAPDKVEWSMTLDDSTTWTRSWTWSLPMTRDDKESIIEFACHEGNDGLAGILGAARADEKHAP